SPHLPTGPPCCPTTASTLATGWGVHRRKEEGRQDGQRPEGGGGRVTAEEQTRPACQQPKVSCPGGQERDDQPSLRQRLPPTHPRWCPPSRPRRPPYAPGKQATCRRKSKATLRAPKRRPGRPSTDPLRVGSTPSTLSLISSRPTTRGHASTSPGVSRWLQWLD